MIDNSWATPVFQQPATLGVDLVIHSASKYIGGHSDTVAGVVAGRQALIDRIRKTICPYIGAKLAPFEAWLLLRGLRTLPVRVRAHEASALAIARRARRTSAGDGCSPSGAQGGAAARPLGIDGPLLFRGARLARHSGLLRWVAPVQARCQLGRSREPRGSRSRHACAGRRAEFGAGFRRTGAHDPSACRPGGHRSRSGPISHKLFNPPNDKVGKPEGICDAETPAAYNRPVARRDPLRPRPTRR